VSPRSETSYKARSPGKSAPHDKAQGSGDRVNGAVVQPQFTSLSGQIRVAGGRFDGVAGPVFKIRIFLFQIHDGLADRCRQLRSGLGLWPVYQPLFAIKAVILAPAIDTMARAVVLRVPTSKLLQEFFTRACMLYTL
jgi:hypothetical protein